MLNKRDMQRYISRMLKGKISHEPEMFDGQLSVFTGAYNLFSVMSSQYVGKLIHKNGHNLTEDADSAPRSCEIYDLRIGVRVNPDGWIDGEIIAKTDCMYVDQDIIAKSENGMSLLQLAVGVASTVTFTAIDGKDSFEMRAVYPRVCKTSPCTGGEYATINLAGVCTVDTSPNPYLNKDQTAVSVMRVVDPKYDLEDWVFNPFFETLVENGLSDADEFTESNLYGQVLVDQTGQPVSAIIFASDHSVTFDANTLGQCVGAARSFTVIAHDVGIVEIQFEHDVEYVGETTGDYEMIRYDYVGDDFGDVGARWDIKELEKRFREILGKPDDGGDET